MQLIVIDSAKQCKTQVFYNICCWNPIQCEQKSIFFLG